MNRYVVLEGGDGCGKSTQARRLAAWLRERGEPVVHLREPGSTPLGEQLRTVLLSPATGDLLPITEALLFSAARAEMVRAEVAPALARGAWVVAERCYFSTLVYQALALDGGVDPEVLHALTRSVHGATLPGLVVVLDVDGATARMRREQRTADRIEQRGAAFADRVRAGFVALARSETNAVLVDGGGDADAVAGRVRDVVQARVGSPR